MLMDILMSAMDSLVTCCKPGETCSDASGGTGNTPTTPTVLAK